MAGREVLATDAIAPLQATLLRRAWLRRKSVCREDVARFVRPAHDVCTA